MSNSSTAGLAAGSHACLVYGDDRAYLEAAHEFLGQAAESKEKTFAFGPEGSRSAEELRPLVATVADPYVAFLGRGPLDPSKMFAGFREQTELARRQGYRGIRVSADMDWLLSNSHTREELIGFEVMLDRVVRDLGATVLCAYRRSSFDEGLVKGMLCVHPCRLGHDEEPPFELTANGGGEWRLRGDVDLGSVSQFAGAVAATATPPWILEATDLAFMDIAGMRAIAEAARSAGVPLEVRGAPEWLQRHWQLAGFSEAVPAVQFTD